jgi:D-galactarolactone cycloisomerase
MWQWSLDFARGGIMMGAMSGIDMALWDLKGKFLGLSVSELMGGRYRDSIPCYATGMYFKEMPQEALIDSLVAEAAGYREQGFQAMKIKVGKNPPFDVRLIAAMRGALPETMLMADANHAYDLPEAVRIGRALDEHGFAWFEEPLSPEYELQFRQLHEKLDVPLAAGECEQTRYGFQRLLSPGGVQIAQPDLAYCGGPSEALKIRSIASSLGVNVIPHCWGTMLNLAAATHFLASGYREPGRAEDGGAILELDRTPNPLRDELFETPLTIDGATVHVPTAPGLGVVVDRSALQSFRVRETETAPLLESHIPAMFTMIGSTAAGVAAMRSSCTNVKHFSVELGGNAPVVVYDDADVTAAAENVVDLKFANTGQVCVSPNRCFVHEAVYEQFIEAAKQRASGITLGAGRGEGRRMGPMLTAKDRDRALKLVKAAEQDGAAVVCGGKIPERPAKGYYLEPTILRDVRQDMRLSCDEIFGPVLPVIRFTDDDDVIAMANDTEYGLAAYVYTSNLSRGLRAAAGIDAGSVCVNECHYAVQLPHGGVKQSGVGKDCSRYSIEEYLTLKRVSVLM